MIRKQAFQSRIRWKRTAKEHRRKLMKAKLSSLPRQPMPEGVTLPSPRMHFCNLQNYCVDNLKMEVIKLENKIRLVLALRDEEVDFYRKKKAVLVSDLRVKGFTPFPNTAKSVETAFVGADDAEDTGDSSERAEAQNEHENSEGARLSDYDYLLCMPYSSLTEEGFQELHAERDKIKQELEEMKAVNPKANKGSSQAGYKASRKRTRKLSLQRKLSHQKLLFRALRAQPQKQWM